jgi:two-component system OmpR family sensor kinase
MIIHSIKWRLQAWHGFLLTVLVCGLMGGFYEFERRSLFQTVDAQLREAMTPLLPRYAPPLGRGNPERGPSDRDRRPPGPEDGLPPRDRFRDDGPPPERMREAGPFNVEKFYFIAWNEQGERIAASTNAPPDLERQPPGGRGLAHILQTRGPVRELIQTVPTGRVILVGTSLTPGLAKLRQLRVALILIGAGIIAVGFAVGWWLANRALRPIAEISQAAQRIAAGDLANRINASETESELGQLITVLNSTFARLESAFAQQQQFTSDAAHELRTPVAVILTQVQSTLHKERSGVEYRETLEACHRAAQRMKRLIESLLELARFDAGQEQLQRVPFNLAAKARECADLLQPLAAERRVKLILDLTEISCTGDPERLSQVIVNLLTNAMTYNQPEGEVRVTTALRDGSAILTVADTGVGIAPEDAPQVFTRFYRADKSRAGSAGNAGLGLAICKSIVTAHGGTLDFTSEPGRGTTFTMRLPSA